MMIDLILLVFVCVVAHGAFRLGARYSTYKSMYDELSAKLKSKL